VVKSAETGALVLLAAMLCAASASADPAATTGDTIDLNELVVTSTGFGEPRATHPGNISKIDADEIDFVKAQQPAELLNRIPGVDIQQGSGVEHLTAIRSPVLTGTAGAGSFLYLEDGVPMRAAGFANVNELMDAMTEEAGGIEVIRGPGSALYGSNAEHGLVNILTRAPSLTPEGSLTGWLGPHGVADLDGTASTSVTSGPVTQGFRGSFALNNDGGFRDHSGYGQQKLQLRYDYSQPDTTVKTTLDTVNINQETAGYLVDPSNPQNIDAYKIDSLRKYNPNPEAYRDAWAIRGAMRIEHDLGNGQKIAITPYGRTNGMNFLMHFQPGEPVEENGHWSGGLLSSYELTLKGGHKIILGFDSEYTDGYLREIQSGAAKPGGYITGVHYNYDVKSTVLAPYLHTIWQLGDATQLTAGIRYEFTRYDYTNYAGPTDTSVSRSVDRFARPGNRVDTYSNPTPKIGLTHVFNDEVTGFVNLAHAARAPQTQDLYRLQKLPGGTDGPDPSTIKSEVLDSIEVGARGKIGRASYELSTYFMKKRNYAFRDSNGDNVTNGRTQHVGIEGELSTPLVWNFDLAASATYARHTYEFTHSSTSFESFVKGADMDTAPRTIANLRLGYAFNEGLGRAELEWVHLGSYWMDSAHTEQYPGHDLFNLRTEYALTGNVTVFGRLENIFDKRYADRADYFQNQARFFPGDGRGLYVGTSLSF
jgi:outer membrane receptor protein involved in Fe transport